MYRWNTFSLTNLLDIVSFLILIKILTHLCSLVLFIFSGKFPVRELAKLSSKKMKIISAAFVHLTLRLVGFNTPSHVRKLQFR